MASALVDAVSTGVQEFNQLPAGRQLALIAILAGGLAIVAGILFWAFRPVYAPLFAKIDGAEAAEVMQMLGQMRVPHRVDPQTGQIEVPHQRIAETRLLLAGQGLPRAADLGFELLQQDSGFGTSRLIEGARHQRAIEGELARSVAALEPVELARVHLAQPERSVFVRERTPPSASVVVHLRGTSALTEAQVAAIVHLVSASVPGLEPERVTVVDQRGRMLTRTEDEHGTFASTDQLEFGRRVEARYVERVLALLEPIVGADRVRVQVAADLDFSRVERTHERFDPERTAVRSEQINQEERLGADSALMGVPGALTNQPPAGGVLGEEEEAAPAVPSNRNFQSTRNFEVDRSIAHIREMPGGVRRVSTAVVVDYKDALDAEGQTIRVARTAEELDDLRALVREAVGFNGERGDSINLIAASFSPAVADDAARAFWSEPWFIELAKIAAALLLAALVLLTVVKPALAQLLPPRDTEPEEGTADEQAQLEQLGEDSLALSEPSSAIAALMGPKDGDTQAMDLEAVREMIAEDPKRVAQVMKVWLSEDGQS